MNNVRRKDLNRLKSQLETILSDLEVVSDLEQSAYDSLPEGLQYSERGEKMSDAIDNLSDAFDYISNAIDSIEEAAS